MKNDKSLDFQSRERITNHPFHPALTYRHISVIGVREIDKASIYRTATNTANKKIKGHKKHLQSMQKKLQHILNDPTDKL
jgi:hypothetical protein